MGSFQRSAYSSLLADSTDKNGYTGSSVPGEAEGDVSSTLGFAGVPIPGQSRSEVVLREPNARGGPGPAQLLGRPAPPAGAIGRPIGQRQIVAAGGLCPTASPAREKGDILLFPERRGGGCRRAALLIAKKQNVPFLQVAKLSLLDVEPTEMLWLLACQWGLNPAPTASAAGLWRAIGDRLCEYRCQQWEAVVLLDDAHRADPQVMQHVTRLARFDPSPEMRLTIVLAGRNEGMARLGESLLGLAALRIELEPWQRSETEEFVNTLFPGRTALAGVRSSGGGPFARACPGHSAPRLPIGRSGPLGRRRPESRSDRRGSGRDGLSGVGSGLRGNDPHFSSHGAEFLSVRVCGTFVQTGMSVLLTHCCRSIQRAQVHARAPDEQSSELVWQRRSAIARGG